MRSPDLTPVLPLGLRAGPVSLDWSCRLGLAELPSLQFLAAYSRARGDLFEYNRLTGVRSLISGAKILPFPQLLTGVYTGFWALAAVTPLAALTLYLYHYQGSHSIYTMRRL